MNSEPKVEPGIMSDSLRNTNVLIVDDNADIRELLRTVLEQFGASVAVAQSVDDAVQAFRRRPAHVVITDMRLGDSDGYVLLHAIRECNAEYRGMTPVLALTGYGSPEDKSRAIAAGFDAYLCKPCDPFEVVNALSKALGGSLDLAA
jgi:CheY-like chemotaxis protein